MTETFYFSFRCIYASIYLLFKIAIYLTCLHNANLKTSIDNQWSLHLIYAHCMTWFWNIWWLECDVILHLIAFEKNWQFSKQNVFCFSLHDVVYFLHYNLWMYIIWFSMKFIIRSTYHIKYMQPNDGSL